jgi:hypothetical protein
LSHTSSPLFSGYLGELILDLTNLSLPSS